MPLTLGQRARLGTVRPELLEDANQLVDAAAAQLGFTLAIPADGGTRSNARQAALYADSLAQGGGTLAYAVGKPGHSRHEYGAAVDFNIVAGGSSSDGTGTDDDYAQLAALAESLPGAPGLIAGYYFASRGVGLKDPYHFQLNEPPATSQAAWLALLKSRVATGGVVLLAVIAAVLIVRR